MDNSAIWPWDQTKYLGMKKETLQNLYRDKVSPSDYMHLYKTAIIDENYEFAKAITEALEPLNFHTADTHRHISFLKNIPE